MNQVDEHLSTADFVAGGGQGVARENAAHDEGPGPLLPGDLVQELRARWDDVQTGFVDEPRQAVQHADELVARAMKHIAESFANERRALEQQWDRGDEVNTEDLRQALRKYRAFFQRLLSI
jgi:serine phosphatase RsbU (regulator of sigma subunit)